MEEQLIVKLKKQINDGKCLSLNSKLVKDFINLYMSEISLNDDALFISENILLENNLLKNSRMLFDFIEYLRYLLEMECSIYLKKEVIELNDVQVILKRLISYVKISKVFKELLTLDSMKDKNVFSNFLNSNVFVNYEDILLSYLNQNYLELPNILIDEIMNSLINSVQFQDSLSLDSFSNQSKIIISKYINYVLPIVEFVSPSFIYNDLVVKKIVNNNKAHKDIIKCLFDSLSVERIMKIFDRLSCILRYVSDVTTFSVSEKKKIVNNLFEKIIREKKFYLFKDIYFTGYQNKMFKSLLDSYKEVILSKINMNSCYETEQIEYMLENNSDEFLVANSMFVLNNDNALLNKHINKKDYLVNILDDDNLELKKNKCKCYNFTGRMIRFNSAMEMLDAYFKGYLELDIHSLMAIIRSIMHQFTTKLDVLMFGSDNYHLSKTFVDKKNIIVLNNRLLYDFLDKSLTMDKRLKIFQVMFSEYRFVMEPFFTKMSKEEYFDNFMLSTLFKYVPDYYEDHFNKLNKNSNISNFGVLNAWRFLRSFNLPFDISYFLEPLAVETNLVEDDFNKYREVFLKFASYHEDVMDEYEKYQIYFNEMDANLKGNLVVA